MSPAETSTTDAAAEARSALSGLDAVLNAPKRLAIMAVLSSSSSTDFGFLRRHLGVSESDLSKQAATLETAGYLSIHKSGHGRGGVTSYKATRTGRKAYQRHRDTLRALLAESLTDDRPGPGRPAKWSL